MEDSSHSIVPMHGPTEGKLSTATPRFETEQMRFRLTVSFIAFLIAHALVSLFGTQYVFQDPDTQWHIRTGQWILDHWSVPFVDPFSHTAYGHPWIANDWLSDLIFAVTFKLGQWRALLELTALSVGAIVAIICFYLTRVLRFTVAVGLTTVTALLVGIQYLARPYIFAYVILSIWMIVLLDRHDRGDDSAGPPLVLIPLMIVWANINGSFTFGLALLYIFAGWACYQHLVQRRFAALRREILLVLVISAGALITPYGIHSLLITPKVFEMKFALQYLGEWRSPDFQALRVHLIFLIALLSVILALGVRLRGPRLPAFMLLAYIGLSHVRGLAMFFLLVPLVLARPAARSTQFLQPQAVGEMQPADPIFSFLHKHAMAVTNAALALAVLATGASWMLTEPRPPDSIVPRAAIEYVKQANIDGNVFNSYNFGGFLILSNIPTFIDGRVQPFGDEFLHRFANATNLVDIDDAFRLLDEYNIHWVLLRPGEPLGKAVARSDAWQKVYSDDIALVFVRRH